ncbi:MAG: alanine--tRNA ligase [Lysobacteraceae bacterium]|nr:MAG: alanine--tRNA ligase [Xanthomonadaceae bacterium]
MKTTAAIRQEFLDYFAQRDHRVVSSSPLVPGNDPTLLFTNAGMVQFKDVFLGAESRSYKRATTSQRCVRAGGKHNDLDQVGYTARHHTFFEMLGNFSFGDYFKREAIEMAWDFLTVKLGIPQEKLWVTVFEEDDEAANIWINDIGVNPDRLSRIGAKDNFWAMGDTGPCGPCTEIFYDHGADVPGGPPGTPEEDGDRYIEIWNLVFMQFDRAQDGSMKPLPNPCVDTGMGLERLAAVLQHVHANYEIDLFQNLIKAAAQLTGTKELDNNSLKVIADHIRACSFLIVDGVLPGNEGRGYVLRRIIRRAIRHGFKLGCNKPFFAQMVAPLVKEMGEAYPELAEKADFVTDTLAREESRFAETLEQGMRLLDATIADLKEPVIPGETAFKLYDTYGFPLDLTADIARERQLTVDHEGFEQSMAAQRARARASNKFGGADHVDAELLKSLPETRFTGYQALSGSGKVLALLHDGNPVKALAEGQEGIVVLDTSPFYAESGGQVGDRGEMSSNEGAFKVADTVRLVGTVTGHKGVVTGGTIRVGETVHANVDTRRRAATIRNHSATHLMHAALRKLLGKHVEQKGSLVDPQRLRFDFSHHQPVTHDQLLEIERMVNAEIRANEPAQAAEMGFDQAVEAGAMALFGEKYGESVRVLTFGEFSCELCGGTHVERTGDIGLFRIVSETGIAAGVRRIEAVTGEAAIELVQRSDAERLALAQSLKTEPAKLGQRIEQLLQSERELKKQLDQLQQKMAQGAGRSLADEATTINGVSVICARAEAANAGGLRTMADELKAKKQPAIIVLAGVFGDKVQIVAAVSDELTKQVPARDLVQVAAEPVEGRGGGRADFAQAGGTRIDGVDAGIDAARKWVESRLAS